MNESVIIGIVAFIAIGIILSCLVPRLFHHAFRPHVLRPEFWDRTALRFSRLMAILYLLITVVPLLMLAGSDVQEFSRLPTGIRVGLVLVGLVVTIGPPLYYWLEARAFYQWIDCNYSSSRSNFTLITNSPQKAIDRYEMNSNHAKALWAGVLAVYAAALIQFSK